MTTYNPGDIVNGWLLKDDGTWTPVPPSAKPVHPDANKSRRYSTPQIVLAGSAAVVLLMLVLSTLTAGGGGGGAKATASGSARFTNVVEDITPQVYWNYASVGANPLRKDGSNPTTRELAATTLNLFVGNNPSVTQKDVAIGFQRTGNIYQFLGGTMPPDQIERLRAACIAIFPEWQQQQH